MPRAIDWSWPAAARGVTYALPAGAVALVDLRAGAGIAIGILPAAIVALPGPRRKRIRLAVFGVLVGLSLFTGSVLAVWPPLAVVGLLAVCVAAALLASKGPAGSVALALCAPIVAIGFSYPGFDGLGRAVLLSAGGVYAWLVSLPWPERVSAASRPLPSRAAMLDYGVRLGLAGAIAAAIGFGFGFEHVGWAAGAALLVMRPAQDLQQLRMVGRVCSVVLGALLAVTLITVDAGDAVLAVCVVACLVGATATAASRWYVTSAFTTFLVFLLLALGDADAADHRFWERVGETVLGVALAYVFGILVPSLRRRTARQPEAPAS